jgi:hypothetical protein
MGWFRSGSALFRHQAAVAGGQRIRYFFGTRP